MLEVTLGVDLSCFWALKEVGDLGKGILVFLCEFIETLKANGDWSPMSFFQLKNTGAPCGDREGWMKLVSDTRS
jgi:hypothetical protein